MKLHAAHAMARRDEKKDRIKPDLKRRAALFKDCPGAGIQIVATMGTRIRLAVLEPMERRIYNAAGLAGMPMAKTHRHNVLKARILIRKTFKEVLDRQFAGNMVLVHVNNLVYTT